MPSSTSSSQSIAKSLAVLVIAVSSVITIGTTAAQLYFDYKTDLEEIKKGFVSLEASHLPSLIRHVWTADSDQVQTLLEGLALLPDFEYLAIVVDDKTRWKAGNSRSKSVISKTYPLVFRYVGQDIVIGILIADASLDDVYNRLWRKMFVVL